MKNLIACATDTIKAHGNQDVCEIIEGPNFRGVVVADGIGSHYKSEVASVFCVKRFKEHLESIESVDAIDFKEIFQRVKSGLLLHVKQLPDLEEYDDDQAFGTTLLCAVESEDEICIAYVGNGSIWHIQGNFDSFGPNRFLPWNAINLLNPHCVEEEGKSALYRYISIAETSCEPTILRLSKNKALGDIIMVATDGVYSYDQVVIGKDPNGKVWISGEETMSLFYEILSKFLATDPLTINDSNLKNALIDYLERVKTQNLMEDDTTLGVIISSSVLERRKTISVTQTPADEKYSNP